MAMAGLFLADWSRKYGPRDSNHFDLTKWNAQCCLQRHQQGKEEAKTTFGAYEVEETVAAAKDGEGSVRARVMGRCEEWWRVSLTLSPSHGYTFDVLGGLLTCFQTA